MFVRLDEPRSRVGKVAVGDNLHPEAIQCVDIVLGATGLLSRFQQSPSVVEVVRMNNELLRRQRDGATLVVVGCVDLNTIGIILFAYVVVDKQEKFNQNGFLKLYIKKLVNYQTKN